MGERISHYRELKVYRKAFRLQQEIFSITKSFPVEERFALIDQIRRSSRSVGANISEAWQKRRYIAHFVSKLSDADGELAETQHWLDTTVACDYISGKKHKELLLECREIGRMIGKMLIEPEKWCDRQSG